MIDCVPANKAAKSISAVARVSDLVMTLALSSTGTGTGTWTSVTLHQFSLMNLSNPSLQLL